MNNYSNNPIYTVSEFSNAIKKIVEYNFQHIRIKGEISSPSFPSSGHVYFNLKDAKGNLSAVIWKNTSIGMKIKPEEGLEVVCSGRISTFSGHSKYQIIVEKIELEGEGALLKLIEERKKKLTLEGLFDKKFKKPIPYLPQVIGIITSPTGSVIKDILQRLSERFPIQVYLWPVQVQGENTATQVSEAIEGFNSANFSQKFNRPDVIIVARGGGSIEDLWSFNEELIVRSVFKSLIPVISAIGHETDTTLIDFASDLRVPTPTAAAEKVVPVLNDVINKLEDLNLRLHQVIKQKIILINENLKSSDRLLIQLKQLILIKRQHLDVISKDYDHLFENLLFKKSHDLLTVFQKINSPEKEIIKVENNLNLFSEQMKNLIKNFLKNGNDKISLLKRLLDSNSYEKVLERGFTITYDISGKIIKRKLATKSNQKVRIIFKDGEREAVIK